MIRFLVMGALLLFVPQTALAQRLPEDVCKTLKRERLHLQTPTVPVNCAKQTYTHPFCAQVGAMLNAVAWEHQFTRWGVSRKKSGNRCPSPAGEISCDVLMLPDGAYWDVLIAVGEETKVNCGNRNGTITAANRGWVEPKNPNPIVVPPEPPVIPPPVVTPEPCTFTIAPALIPVTTIPPAEERTDYTITTGTHCQWEMAASEGWIHLSGKTQTGPGTVTVLIDANTGVARSGEYVIAGSRTIVHQQAVVTPPSGSGKLKWWMIVLSLLAGLSTLVAF